MNLRRLISRVPFQQCLFTFFCLINDATGATTATHYVGCYYDEPVVHESKVYKSDNINPTKCQAYCYTQDKTYAVMTEGNECHCTDSPPVRALPANRCSLPCKGDEDLTCGGKKAYDYFTSCAKTFWGPRCAWRCFCADKLPCQVYLGLCTDNKCVESHMGQFCETEKPTINQDAETVRSDFTVCPRGKYGPLCHEECKCVDKNCQTYTGVCAALCPEGIYGKRCEFQRSCTKEPCKNGGVCKDNGLTFECECPDEYRGQTCTFMNSCLSQPCQFGGICVSTGNAFSCLCDNDYYGFLCEIRFLPNDSSTNDVEYLGCFRYFKEEANLLHNRILWGKSLKMSIDKCVRHCRSQLYTYAGLQFGDGCWCGDSYVRYGSISEDNCNVPCTSDKTPQCGGKLANSIYTTCPLGKYTFNCNMSCHCSGRQCDLRTGHCEDWPCIGGWTGKKCDQLVHPPAYSDKRIIMLMLLAFAGCAMSLTAYNGIVHIRDYFEKTGKKPRKLLKKSLETRSSKRRKRTISKMQKLLGSNKTKKEEEQQPDANAAAEDSTAKPAKDKTGKHGAKPIEGHEEGQSKDTKQGQAKDQKHGQVKDAKQGQGKDMEQAET